MKKFIKKNYLLILAIVYFLSPLDFIPDALFPVVGLSDDLLLMLIALGHRYIDFKRQQKEDEKLKRANIQEGEVVED